MDKKICLRWIRRQIKKEIIRTGAGLPLYVSQDAFLCITSAPGLEEKAVGMEDPEVNHAAGRDCRMAQPMSSANSLRESATKRGEPFSK